MYTLLVPSVGSISMALLSHITISKHAHLSEPDTKKGSIFSSVINRNAVKKTQAKSQSLTIAVHGPAKTAQS
jgi:hypothetical protein